MRQQNTLKPYLNIFSYAYFQILFMISYVMIFFYSAKFALVEGRRSPQTRTAGLVKFKGFALSYTIL